MTTNGNHERPLPKTWETVNLYEVTDISYGKGLPVRDRIQGGSIPVIGSSGVVGNHSQSLVDGPVLIIGRKGSAGAVYLIREGCWPIDTTYYAYPKTAIDINYLFYALQTLHLESLDKSTAIPSLSRDDLYVQAIPLAPLLEQRRIVAEIEKQFTRLDAGVAALKTLQHKLTRYKASLLKHACEGKLVPQDPTDEPADQLLQRILAERRRQWEAQEWQNLVEKARKKAAQARRKAAGRPARLSDLTPTEWQTLPEAEVAPYLPKNNKWKSKYKPPVAPTKVSRDSLPSGWIWTSVDQAIRIIDYRGRTPPFSETGIIHLRSSNVRNGSVNWSNLAYVSEATYERFMTRGLPEQGDLLFTTEAPLGEVARVPYPLKFSLAQRMMLLRTSKDYLLPDYLMYQIMSPQFQNRISRSKTGTTVTGVSSRNLRPTALPLAPLAEQERIVAEIERRLSIITAVEHLIQTNRARAERLRQSILHHAFTGRLVPQDPSDEPASALLARIHAQREATP